MMKTMMKTRKMMMTSAARATWLMFAAAVARRVGRTLRANPRLCRGPGSVVLVRASDWPAQPKSKSQLLSALVSGSLERSRCGEAPPGKGPGETDDWTLADEQMLLLPLARTAAGGAPAGRRGRTKTKFKNPTSIRTRYRNPLFVSQKTSTREDLLNELCQR